MVKIKFCGISHIEDAILASKYADFIGIVTDPVSPRFVKPEFVNMVKSIVQKPVVNVKVNSKIKDIVAETNADYIQIHRILEDSEIEELLSYGNNFILYAPSSMKYEAYFKKLVNRTNYLILVDSERKGEKVTIEVARKWVKEYDKVGIGGGITPDNVRVILELEPYWIDISSGVEKYKSKKDPNKMLKLVEKVRQWISIQ